MKNLHSLTGACPTRSRRGLLPQLALVKRTLLSAGAALLAAGFLGATAQAQTTIKPYQIRLEVPSGYSGTIFMSNNVMRVATNGAAPDITGTNWVISPVSVNITGAPAGVTAIPTDSSGNLVTTVPINLNTGNASTSTNLMVKLTFNGAEASGATTLSFNATGGVTNDFVLFTLEVGKIWNGAGNAALNGPGYWSDSSKWLGGIPGPNDNVVFTDVGAQTNTLLSSSTATNILTNSVIDVSTTIASLRFASTNNTTNAQNLVINPGINLAIRGPGGLSMLRDETYVATAANVTFTGTNGTLIVTNESASLALLDDGQIRSYMDMSRLGNLYMDVNQMPIGDILAYPNYLNLVTNGYTSGSTLGGSRPQKAEPTWSLALTNYVRAVYADPYNYTNGNSRNYALMIGRNELTGGSSGNFYNVFIGVSNVFNLDGICVAGYGALGSTIAFLNTNSYALFRGTNGGRMSIFTCADAAGTASQNAGANTKCGNSGFGVDFTKGYVDISVDRFYMSRDRAQTTGAGVVQASMGMSSGILNANTAVIGDQESGNQTNQNSCTGTLTVSNTAVFQVNGALALGYTTATAGDPSTPASTHGQITIGPGGTVIASKITVGGTTKTSTGNTITMTSGSSLIVSNTIADGTPNGALGTLSMGGNSALTLFINGTNPTVPLVYLTNFTASSTGNKLIIGGVTNFTFPAYVPLIAGVGGPSISAASFDAGVTMPTGSGLHGTLVTSSSNTIDLQIISRVPNHLLWRAPAGGSGTANWDFTSKVWLDQVTGLMTNYDNPDICAFDDAAGYATNVVIAGSTAMTPSVVNLTNVSRYYTFMNGGGQITGGPIFSKNGTGTVEIDGNTTFTVQVNQGTFTGNSSGVVGGVSVAAGAVMNYQGTVGGSLISAGTATSAGTISGTLTVQSGGMVTNSGTVNNPILVQSGGLLYNSGTLTYVGVGSSGSPQVASGGTLINNGAIGSYGGGSILYVNGTFEDLGGGSDNLTLNSVTIGAGGTFIPGGSGIGTTTINTDGTTAIAAFPGAALLVQGSTNIFNINVAGGNYTVLSVNALSFGGSSSQRSQNGATLVLNNTSGTPFSAGQSFQLFNTDGYAPASTGTSTNTYPVIVPASPGPGLSWDLSQLWASGSIGVVSATSGPTFTSSFALDSTGTNIVGNFSWTTLGYRLETQVNPASVGLSTNWTGVSGSFTNLTESITNVFNPTNAVFYRLSFP